MSESYKRLAHEVEGLIRRVEQERIVPGLRTRTRYKLEHTLLLLFDVVRNLESAAELSESESPR
jgi:hypothetical protein